MPEAELYAKMINLKKSNISESILKHKNPALSVKF